LVERVLAKHEVDGSKPFTRSIDPLFCGLERPTAQVLGLKNIAEATLCLRDVTRLEP
jgi:hypothetical protein